jgi:hypothetical protein
MLKHSGNTIGRVNEGEVKVRNSLSLAFTDMLEKRAVWSLEFVAPSKYRICYIHVQLGCIQ